MSWEVRPEPNEEGVQAVLVAAVEQELGECDESAWWRSGFDELGGSPAPKQTWSDPGIVEP
jgi:hypothetical protein